MKRNLAQLRVAVTGGRGIIGRPTLDALAAAGHAPVSISRASPGGGVPGAVGDIRDVDRMAELFAGMDVVIHLAGLDSISQSSAADFFDVNGRGTWSVLEAARRAGVGRVVYGSSMSIYGLDHTNPDACPHRLPVDEDHPVYPSAPYAFSKQIAEMFCCGFAWRHGMRVCVLRISAVISPQDHRETSGVLQETADTWADLPRPLPAGFRADGTYSVPKMRSYLMAADAATALVAAAERTPPGCTVLNICADDTLVPHATRDLCLGLFGRVPLVTDPGRYDADPRAAIYDNRRARSLIGWAPAHAWRAASAALFAGEAG